ncbi:MAG: aminotransferase class I/II-fold pyridoxal phosphate-dependent enzyme, partial [Gammaproteobacteria bacterium]|nr:aminotransferase class I/II-fold pyridoxal phosphate-dependent enzyme [Gammaproteobacteria bacterium]
LPIIEAGRQSLADELTHYTPALGLPELRKKIAEYYQTEFNVDVNPRRIIITPGASGALQLALAVTVNPGDQVMMADPGYPCNRHMVRMFEGEALSVPVNSDSLFQLTPELIDQYWSDRTVAAMIASPSNPTGTRLEKEQMKALIGAIQKHNGLLMVDEIYQGLVYDAENYTALSLADEIVIINSFSKYFGMTGWRLGWMVVPEEMIDAIDRVSQNIFLAASTPAQYAALAAFSETSMHIIHQRRDEFQQRRDYLLPALKNIGFKIEAEPQGAFYIYADCSAFTDDSFKLSADLLEKAGVAVTPGKDFGANKASQYLRFAYTQPIDKLEQGIARLKTYLKG